MKETKRRHRFFDAWSSRVCTLSAPGSSPRNARRADVSRTKDLSAAIFLLPVSPALLQQLANQSLFARTTECVDWIVGDRNEFGRTSLDHPFHSRIRAYRELFSNFWRNGHLSAFWKFCTHITQVTRQETDLQDMTGCYVPVGFELTLKG